MNLFFSQVLTFVALLHIHEELMPGAIQLFNDCIGYGEKEWLAFRPCIGVRIEISGMNRGSIKEFEYLCL